MAKKAQKKARKKSARKTRARSAKTQRKRWGLILLLFFLGFAIGLIAPWAWWLDREASVRFAERQWTQAGRVYARALELYPGRPLSHQDLALELAAAGLTETLPLLPGRYQRAGDRSLLVVTAGDAEHIIPSGHRQGRIGRRGRDLQDALVGIDL